MKIFQTVANLWGIGEIWFSLVVEQRDMRFLNQIIRKHSFLTSVHVVVFNIYQLYSACTGYNQLAVMTVRAMVDVDQSVSRARRNILKAN